MPYSIKRSSPVNAGSLFTTVLLATVLTASRGASAQSPTTGATASVPASHESHQRIRLGHDQSRTNMEFANIENRVTLASLRDVKKTEWAGRPPEKAGLWRLQLRGPNKATLELVGGELPILQPHAEDTGVRFTWKAKAGDGQAEINLTITNDAPDGMSRWHLNAVLPAGWKVARADWPILPNLRCKPDLKMAAPIGWGIEYNVKKGMGYEGTYPSLITSMPFVAFYNHGKGLYVGMHDRTASHKHFSVKAREDGVNVTCTHWPAESDTANGRYDPAFHVAIGLFDGDYWEAAQIYRSFNIETPWGSAYDGLQLTHPKRSIPTWLKDIDLWLMPEAEPLKNVELCRKAGEFFGVPIALHWYNWHEIPFDTLYPEYFPPKPNFREGVKALQDAGFRVMPYINGRLCDPKSKTWTQEGGDKLAARQENGELYTEVYGSKVPLHVMCPATPQWRDKIAGITQRLVNEYGVDGVYIDQIGAAAAMQCFSTEHGHSPGGGTFWYDGYRRMLDQIRAKLPEGRILTTEENAECWNDQFDALLLVNTPANSDRRIIPLMPSVYGGRMITFGFQYIAGDDIPRSLPFRAKMSRAFLWGSQLGWVSDTLIMAESARKEAEFLRNLAQARRGGHEYLLNGRFLGEAAVTGDNPRCTGEGSANKTYTIDLPSVMATAWRAPDKSVGLALVNISDEPRTVTVQLPWQHMQALDDQNPLSLAVGTECDGSHATIPVTLAPRDGKVIRVGATVTTEGGTR